MANLEKRVTKLERAKSGFNFIAVVMPGEDENAEIKRVCQRHGVSRRAFDAARKKSAYPMVMHIRFVSSAQSHDERAPEREMPWH